MNLKVKKYNIIHFTQFLTSPPSGISLSSAVNITFLSVPRSVRAYTSPVILDCVYKLPESQSMGLVVKWWVIQYFIFGKF